MEDYPHAPHGDYASVIRNMFLTTAVGLTSIGLKSQVSARHRPVAKLVTICILLYSMAIGAQAASDVGAPPHELEAWRRMTYVFMGLIAAIIFMVTAADYK